MAFVIIKNDLCKGCGLCVKACPQKILALSKTDTNKSGYFVVTNINSEKCTGCAACAIMCPDVALEVDK
ncbi:MAG: 4Fe-4S dicluster domain-containing protein [Christensenellales bacterium]|jgi:2-oxoglutarate ferredoxin oxidoreductase subunit delta